MKDESIGNGLPARGRQGVAPDGDSSTLPPASEKRLLQNQRRLEQSSNRSLRWAAILMGLLVLVFLLSWVLGGRN